MTHRDQTMTEEKMISLTGHGQISWELDLKLICYKGQKPVATVVNYKDYSIEDPDIVGKARQQIEESGLMKSTIENTTSTYVGYRSSRKSGYVLMIAPRQKGWALSISLPSKWDWETPQILRLAYTAKSKDDTEAVEKTAILWVLPTSEARVAFQQINDRYKTQLPKDQVTGVYHLPESVGVEGSEPDWSFIRELESSSCCVVGRDEPKFPNLENYTIPEKFVPEFLALCLPTLVKQANQQ